ncbi:MAG: adenosylcobalamin-dependent ribonucleoside-diphosphate reductase [Candidatus Pacearchaeota archaeon]
MIKQIIKRDGRIVEFDKTKIAEAIWKAVKAVGGRDKQLAYKLADKVVEELERVFTEKIPSVEDVQDVVEKVLIEEGHAKTAKAYILYRQERRFIREEKKKILCKDGIDEVDKNFDLNALRVLASRYLNKDEEGKIIESPKQLFERVAISIGLADILHDQRVFNKDGIGCLKDREIEEELKEVEELKARNEREGIKINVGNYSLNKWHVEALLLGYSRLLRDGKIKINVRKLIEKLEGEEFKEYEKNIKEYYDLMVSKDFMPNSPTLMNAGNKLGQLSACFVLPIEDSLVSIMKSASEAAFIGKAGGGVGMNYSLLRPRNDVVLTTSGIASGPVSFMEIINTITEVVKQGGKRRGANMAILEVWHPDIEEFINIKQKPGKLENFNLSVGIWDDFIKAIYEDSEYSLINPRTKKVVKSVPSKKLFDLICFSAWKSAEPGVLFFNNINKYNILEEAKGLIRSTNPCGEQPLYEYESCNLGSINLKNFVVETVEANEFDWKRFEKVIRLCTRFLDNVVDINKYPISEIEATTRASRKIGLGVMGLSDCLFELGIPYNSEAGYKFMNKVAEALTYFSMDESCEIAKQRGSFPLYSKSSYPKGKLPVAGYYELPKSEHNYDWEKLIAKTKQQIRNSYTTTIAPTGSISMIAGCGNGIEPAFSLVFEKHVAVGKFYYVDSVFERRLKAMGIYTDSLLDKICKNYGCLFGLSEFDENMQRVFVTALSMHWLDHIIAQAIWQRWISASISKTINVPNDASIEDIKLAYLIANELGLKGLTVYRDGSRNQQVLYVRSEEKQRLFNIIPSVYAISFIKNIKNAYLKKELLSYINRLGINFAKTISESKIEDLEGSKEKKVNDDTGLHYSLDDGKCPLCSNKLIFEAGCNKCLHCGWSSCVIS